MKKHIKTFLNKNDIYLLGTFTCFSLFGITLILLGAITKDINWVYSSIGIILIGLLIGLTYVVIEILGLIQIIKERKLKK